MGIRFTRPDSDQRAELSHLVHRACSQPHGVGLYTCAEVQRLAKKYKSGVGYRFMVDVIRVEEHPHCYRKEMWVFT